MITYLLEFSLMYAMCWIGYQLFLKKAPQYMMRRFFIIGSLLCCLFIPLLPNFFIESSVFNIGLPAVTIQGLTSGTFTSTEAASSSISNMALIGILIITITFLFMLKYFISIINLYAIISKGKKTTIKNYNVVYSDIIECPCSFYKYILLPTSKVLTADELEIVLLHEQMHIDLNHSIEKTIIQLGKAIFWWHPTSWLFSKELSLVHEYEVDLAVLELVPKETYSQILLQFILNPLGLRIVNPFSSNIKKRITMMNTKNEKPHPVKSGLLFLLLMVGGLFIHSCQSQVDNTVKVDLQDSDDSDYYEKEIIDTLIVFNTETMKETTSIVSSTEKIFKKPDSLPLFPGCEEGLNKEDLKQCSQNKLLQFVYTNIVYPEEAKKNGVEGVAVVQFVVGDDGYVFDVTNVRTLDPSTTASVNNMMEKLKEIKWIPGVHQGKPVNVQYSLPVKFKLQ